MWLSSGVVVQTPVIRSLQTSFIFSSTHWNLPLTEPQGTEVVYLARRFRFVQVLEVWILGTVKSFLLRQVFLMPKFRLRQVSLCRNYKRVAYFYILIIHSAGMFTGTNCYKTEILYSQLLYWHVNYRVVFHNCHTL